MEKRYKTQDEIEKIYGHDAKFCMMCRYSLNGLEEGKCPECNWPFDVNNRRTYLKADDIVKRSWRWSIRWWLAVIYQQINRL